MTKKRLTPKQKVAVVFLALGEELAGELLKLGDRHEVGEIVAAMQGLGRLEQEEVDAVLEEFYGVLMQPTAGGIAGGQETAQAFLGKVGQELGSGQVRIEAVDGVDGKTLAKILTDEHPQTIALVIASCDVKKRGEALKALPAVLQTEVLRRMATLGPVAPETLEAIELSLRAKLAGRGPLATRKLGGADKVAKLLTAWEEERREEALAALQQRRPDVSAEVRRHLLTFADVLNLDGPTLQRLLKQCERSTLLKALKIADEKVKAKIMANMSERAAKMLAEELEVMGRLRRSEADAAQQQILSLLAILQKNEV